MTMTKLHRRSILLATAFAVGVPIAAPAVAEGPVKPTYGTIRSLYGTIRSLDGPIDPQYGTIRSLYGTIRSLDAKTSPYAVDAQPTWGPSTATTGDIRAFYGTIRSLNGELNPLYGTIRSLDGQVNPLYGTIRSLEGDLTEGDVQAYMGHVNAFWGELGPLYGTIRSLYGTIRSLEDRAALAGGLGEFVSRSEAFWGPSVTQATGKSFREGFADAMLARHGIDLSDPGSLDALKAEDRGWFFLDWYDGLMAFSGADRTDHWMSEINWTPSLTQVQGAGADAVIGLLDFSVTGDPDVQGRITRYDGVSNFSNGHGAAVASLMVSAHDGKGVMGIAPNASVVAYNPFDETATANWGDITTGVKVLAENGASIVNASLGVPGWTLNSGWNDVFSDPGVAAVAGKTVFVLAAGNDGLTQTQDVAWNHATNPQLLVVGSVDPTGTISEFSNRPGNACLTRDGACDPADLLKNRFLVAPGELILVSDDKGGTIRQSGTSFAAPLVSGTIALLHDRWPWLAKHPKETVDIVLKSARDLGAPGVDEVYGAGMLDATAAQAPLNFWNLSYYEPRNGSMKLVYMDQIRNTRMQSKWEAVGAYFYGFETIGGTFRDFAIPFSSKLVGESVNTPNGALERLQGYVYSRLQDWLKKPAAANLAPGFSNFATAGAAVPNAYGMNITMSVAPRAPRPGYRNEGLPYQSSVQVTAPDDAYALAIGQGGGAVALGGQAGFGLSSDYDADEGGVNPLLGMASGGFFANARVALNDRLSLSAGTTERRLRRDLYGASLGEQAALAGLAPNDTEAQHIAVTYRVTPAVTLTGGLTRLREDSALLGVQSTDRSDFARGSTTEGASMGAAFTLPAGLNLSLSGTVGRTRANGGAQQNVTVADGGLVTTSYQVALDKAGVFGRGDRARLTLSQPMYLERGAIDYATVQVIDRQTGQLGVVNQRFDIATTRRQYLAEAIYAAPISSTGEMSLFGRAQLRPAASMPGIADYMGGARVSFAF